jgi:uncharacterized protein
MSSHTELVLEYAANRFGAIDPNGFNEIVTSEPPIFVHLACGVQPSDPLTLFTTGMSEIAMPSLNDSSDAIRFAELFIQLPANWLLDPMAIRDMNNAWPILALRELAQMPHKNGRNIGGAIGIVERDGPDDFLASNALFTGFLLMRDGQIETEQQNTISLFRVTPLYWEELQLVQEKGLVPLLHGFDRCSTPRIVDLHRTNVAV